MAELYTRSWKTRTGESWCYWIDYYVDGKRIRKSLGTQKIKEAEAKKRRIERDVEDGCHVRKRGTVTFGEAYESYLENRIRCVERRPVSGICCVGWP